MEIKQAQDIFIIESNLVGIDLGLTPEGEKTLRALTSEILVQADGDPEGNRPEVPHVVAGPPVNTPDPVPLFDFGTELDVEPRPASKDKPTRREFFQSAILDSITTTGTLLLLSRILSGRLTGEPFKPDRDPDDGTYRFTNGQVSFDDTSNFTNIGVRHTYEDLMRDCRMLLNAIRAHDTVMVEGFQGQSYFDDIAIMAHQESKKLVRLESDIPHAKNLLSGLTPLITIPTFLMNVLHYADRGCLSLARLIGPASVRVEDNVGNPREWENSMRQVKPTYRRTAITALAYFLDSVFGVSSDISGNRYPLHDSSHTIDGRTVIMLDEVRTYLKSHPGEKVLVITGDAHARGFHLYMSKPELRDTFERKLALYNRIYKPILGGNAQEELSPAVGQASQ